MPQLFQVLRCYKCLVFQVHQTKKSNKWQCKMCGEKQSLKRHYGLGNSKECRLHVQKLNGMREEIEDEKLNTINSDIDSSDSAEDNIDINLVQKEIKTKSKWSTYIENHKVESPQDGNEPMYLGNNEVCLEIPRKMVKSRDNKRKNNSLSSNIAYKTNNFKTPYKYEFDEVSTPIEHEITKHVKRSKSNIVDTDEINKHKVVSPSKEQGHKKDVISKWAQFFKTDELTKNDDCPAQYKTVPSVTKLFELCDDSDLDEVLSV